MTPAEKKAPSPVVAEKLCVFCKHLEWDYSPGGGGCETCGYGGEGEAKMTCVAGHWNWGEYDEMVDYREKILRGMTCKDYQQVKIKGFLSK